jgi:hypothetical protein
MLEVLRTCLVVAGVIAGLLANAVLLWQDVPPAAKIAEGGKNGRKEV